MGRSAYQVLEHRPVQRPHARRRNCFDGSGPLDIIHEGNLAKDAPWLQRVDLPPSHLAHGHVDMDMDSDMDIVIDAACLVA
mgnify:CR=1 FL=1